MKKSLRVLIVEDVPSDAELAQRELKTVLENFSVKVVDTEEGFLQALGTFNPDLIISDYRMPAFDGLSALKITQEKSPFTPFIILTGSMNEDTAVECMNTGADDYVIKEHIKRLGPAVLNAIDKKKMEQERHRTEKALSEAYNIINRSPAVAFLWKNEAGWPVEFVSKNVEKLFGYSDKEFLDGKISYSEIIHRDDLERVAGEVTRYSKTKGLQTFTHKPYRIITKNGNIKWIEDITYIRRDSRGKITHYEGIVYDITARKQAEDDKEQSQSLLKAALESTADGILVVTREGNWSSFNQKFIDMWGIPTSIWETNDDKAALKYVLDSLVEPDEFLTKIGELYANPEKDSFDMIKMKDGRIFERYSQPQWLNEEVVGRVWSFRDITARKQAEEQLIKLSQSVEQSPASVMITDPDGNLEYVNPKFEQVSGYSSKEVLGQNPRIINSGVQSKELYTDLWRTITSGKEWRGEFCNKKKTGELYWELVSISPIIDKEGTITHFLAVKEDITQRKLDYEEIAHLKEFNESILDGMAEGVVVLDTEGTMVYVNTATKPLLGYTEEELLGQHWSLIIPKDQHATVDAVDKLRVEGDSSIYELQLARKDGQLIDVMVSGNPRYEKGEFIGTLAVFSDITKQKMAVRELRSSEERYRLIFNHAPDAYFISDLKGKTLDVNVALENLLGLDKTEIIGKNFFKLGLISKTHLPGAFKILSKTIKGKTTEPEEFTFFRKDGSKVKAGVRMHFIKIGDKFRILGIARDITKRKKAEEERELALQEAQNANEVKNLFLANMSHEIRTPLNTILGFTGLIEESTRHVIGEEERKFFKVISTSGERLMHTVHEILDISLIDTGTYVMKLEEFNLMSEVQELVDGIQMNAVEKQLKLEFHSTRKHISVRGDRYGISQSISNLIDNAIKYTEKGKITISLRQKSKSAILTIQDTGIGISQEYLDKIFEVFSQESEGYTKKYQGIGLGMAIVKGHLDLNHVNIAIDSTQGKGTTIILTFPNPNEINYQQMEAKKDDVSS